MSVGSSRDEAAFQAKMAIVRKTDEYISAAAALKALLEELREALYYPPEKKPSQRLLDQIQRNLSKLDELRDIDAELARAYDLYTTEKPSARPDAAEDE